MSLKIYKKVRLNLLVLLLVGLVFAFVTNGYGHAQSTVVQAFSSASPLQTGTIVQLESHGTSAVTPLTQSDITQMYGAVVSPNDSPLTLSNPSATAAQTYVATGGSYDVLVSTQNGDIKTGDYVTISALNGVGMKADSNESLVLGKALGDFDSSDAISSTTLKSSSGSSITVSIGLVPVSIGVAHNPLAPSGTSYLPGFLGKTAQAVTDRPVDNAKIYLGLVMLLLTTILSCGLLYAGVRSSLIAIGRNPLSKKSVLRGMTQVTLIALIIFILGLFGVYLLLIL